MNNNYYNFNITRTGLSKESDEYEKKGEYLSFFEQICSSKKIRFNFDIHQNVFRTKFNISGTGTNYGIYIQFPHVYFERYIFDFYIKNKQLKNVLNIDLKNEEFVSKYNQNTKYIFDSKINGVAVVPNENKDFNLDYNKLNKFMNDNEYNFIKLHPVSSIEYNTKLEKKYGKERLIKHHYDLTDIIKKCKTVAVTSNTESMIPSSIYNKNIYLLGTDNLLKTKKQSTYELFYLLLKNNININDAVNTNLTGLVPWSLCKNEKYLIDKIDKMEQIYDNWRDSIYNCTV